MLDVRDQQTFCFLDRLLHLIFGVPITNIPLFLLKPSECPKYLDAFTVRCFQYLPTSSSEHLRLLLLEHTKYVSAACVVALDRPLNQFFFAFQSNKDSLQESASSNIENRIYPHWQSPSAHPGRHSAPCGTPRANVHHPGANRC
jgi:hypothetical protein